MGSCTGGPEQNEGREEKGRKVKERVTICAFLCPLGGFLYV